MTETAVTPRQSQPGLVEATIRESPGDEFAMFVRAKTPALLRAAFLLTGDRQFAEDLVQSALARTHRAWKRLHHNGNAEAYTRKTMYHLQVSWWRKKRIAESFHDTMPEPAAPDSASHTTLRVALRKALLKLAPRQRAVIVLRYFEQRTIPETADLLGCSEGTVKSQTSKALARLRELEPELDDRYAPEGSMR